jgi:hypothetical protein
MTKNKTRKDSKSPFHLIDERIKELGDWRGTQVWEHNGMISTEET